MPVGPIDDGLPVSLQIVDQRFADEDMSAASAVIGRV